MLGSGTAEGDNMRLLWDVLLAQHLEVYAGAGAGHLAGNRDDGEVVAVADFDHETVGVMEEELVYLDPAFFHHCPHVLDLHFLQLFLHSPHALALEGNMIILGIDYTLPRLILWVLGLQKMNSNSMTKQPCTIKIKRSRPSDRDKAKNILVKINGFHK